MNRYKKIALASTFSPRFLPLLAEAQRLVQKLGCALSLIHAGEENEESRVKFAAAFDELAISPHPQIHWAKGEAAAAILETIRAEQIDLLIAGALETEHSGRHYVGNVARVLLRDAPCSLLLFVKPSRDAQPFRQIVTITDFSELSAVSLQRTYFLAEQNAAENIRIVRIFTIFSQALEQPEKYFGGDDRGRSMREAEERRIMEFAESVGPSPVPVEAICVEGTTGFAASDYVQAVEADLLVIPSQQPGTPQLLPDGMDWVFNVIPSNLFIVRDGGVR
ncbi:MAG: universal stress protein [Chthoniobacteraceae bacterium]